MFLHIAIFAITFVGLFLLAVFTGLVRNIIFGDTPNRIALVHSIVPDPFARKGFMDCMEFHAIQPNVALLSLSSEYMEDANWLHGYTWVILFYGRDRNNRRTWVCPKMRSLGVWNREQEQYETT